MEWKKILGIFSAAIVAIGIAVMMRGNAAGIFPIGKEAVYISGEACTVNAHSGRSVFSLIDDCRKCGALHAVYLESVKTSSTSTTSTSSSAP